MPYCVMVAPQILDLLVVVRIHVGQPVSPRLREQVAVALHH